MNKKVLHRSTIADAGRTNLCVGLNYHLRSAALPTHFCFGIDFFPSRFAARTDLCGDKSVGSWSLYNLITDN